jgi:LUD domain
MMTTSTDDRFAAPASDDQLARTAEALAARGFEVRQVATASAARGLVADLLPTDRTIFTTASETLRLSGIDEDVNQSGHYLAIRPKLAQLDFLEDADERRRLTAGPDVAIGSVQAVTHEGQVVLASASGSQIGAFSAAGKTIWIIGAQKIVPDLDAAMRRIYDYCYPLENVRARKAYGSPSAVAKVLIVERELLAKRATVILVKEPIGY